MSNSGQIAADQRRAAALSRGQCLRPRSPGKPATATNVLRRRRWHFGQSPVAAPPAMRAVAPRVQDPFRFVAYKRLVVGIPAGGLTEGTIMVTHLRLQRASRAFRLVLVRAVSLRSVLKVFQAPAAAGRA